MDLYKRKEGKMVVEAIQLTEDKEVECCKTTEKGPNKYLMDGKAGDYLVNFEGGNIKLIVKEAFENNYEKVEA